MAHPLRRAVSLRPVPFHCCLGHGARIPSHSLVSTPRGMAHRQSRADRRETRQPARACQQPGRASWRMPWGPVHVVADTSRVMVMSTSDRAVMITSRHVSSCHVLASLPTTQTFHVITHLTRAFTPILSAYSPGVSLARPGPYSRVTHVGTGDRRAHARA